MKQIPIILFLFANLIGFSQNENLFREQLKAGKDLFAAERYFEAFEHFQLAEKLDDTDQEVKEYLGLCYYYRHNPTEAIRYLQYFVEDKNTKDLRLLFHLAAAYHETYQFKKAVIYYKAFLREADISHPRRDFVKDQIRRCGYGISNSSFNNDVIVENLGPAINSNGNDIVPRLSPNYTGKLYFSSNREGVLGGRRDENGLADEQAGTLSEDMFSSEIINGVWSGVKPLSYLLNGPRNDVILDFNNQGNVLIFYKGFTLYGGDIMVDTFKKIEERTLFSNHFESPMHPEIGDIDLHLFNDSTLLFSSKRSGGYGGLDLYITQRRKGIWVKPVNLGPTINTAYDETSPFLAIDGRTLYFSSNRSDMTYGGYDIFKVNYIDYRESWGDIENLGLPINSSGDDNYFRLSHDGMKAYYASNRKNQGLGGYDLYGVYYKSFLKEQAKYSMPLVFSDVKGFKNQLNASINSGNDSNPSISTQDVEEFKYESIYYNDDSDLLKTPNLITINSIVGLLDRYPSLKILLSCHSDNTEPDKFDLFFSIKRGEVVAKYMIEKGIPPSKIAVRGCGKQYSVALNNLKNKDNPLGRKLNRRISFSFGNVDGLPIKLINKDIEIAAQMKSPAYKYYKTAVKGLSYKVKISESSQMYNGPLITEFPNATVDKNMASDNYTYSIGLYQTFASAFQFKKLLEKRAQDNVSVLAYLNGIPIHEEQLGVLVKAFPDLQQYILAKNNQ